MSHKRDILPLLPSGPGVGQLINGPPRREPTSIQNINRPRRVFPGPRVPPMPTRLNSVDGSREQVLGVERFGEVTLFQPHRLHRDGQSSTAVSMMIRVFISFLTCFSTSIPDFRHPDIQQEDTALRVQFDATSLSGATSTSYPSCSRSEEGADRAPSSTQSIRIFRCCGPGQSVVVCSCLCASTKRGCFFHVSLFPDRA